MNATIETELSREFLIAKLQCMRDILAQQQELIAQLIVSRNNCCIG